jgi:hypothetical protein
VSEQRPEERAKRIRLTVEWIGACSEETWALELKQVIERADYSRVTRVTLIEALTDEGTTRIIPVARLRELGYSPLWERDPWYVRWRLWWRR